MAKKHVTTMRLTEEACHLLKSLSDQYGISHTAVVELAIREKARRDTPLEEQDLAAARERRTPVRA